MKTKVFWLSLSILLIFSGVLSAQTAVSLDDAIITGAFEIENRLPAGIKVVVLNFTSPSPRLSSYVIDEMMTALVRSGKVQVVDRANLELIRSEMNFQLSGDVSDSSAQRIGELLGAQSIISGNIEDMGSFQRMRFRVIAVETAAVQAMTSHNVRVDSQMTNLMRDSSGPARGLTQFPKGLNYSTGSKVGTGFLNMLLGAGSFSMGDPLGGIIVGGIQAAGITTMIIVISKQGSMRQPVISDYEIGPDIGYLPTFYDEIRFRADENQFLNDLNRYTVYGFLGAGLYGAGVIIGFVRPFAYDVSLAKKRGTYTGFIDNNPMNHITIDPIIDRSGVRGVSFNYRVSY